MIANAILIDLRPDEETILQRMKPKTRYNIRLAQRKGVEVRSAGVEGLETWCNLYVETAMRNGLTQNDLNYFKYIFTSKMERMDKDVNVQLLIAYHEHTPLAAMFLVVSDYRATYLYGASSSSCRNLMPTYALQWRAMQIAKSLKCLEYDMFGIAPNPAPSHPMYGLYKFKQGFGGNIFHQLGCWDYPIDNDKYNYFAACEMNMQGYYQP
ncbi:MAG: lipid II:glycine glycyltransferase FemX [Prevotella sp.]